MKTTCKRLAIAGSVSAIMMTTIGGAAQAASFPYGEGPSYMDLKIASNGESTIAAYQHLSWVWGAAAGKNSAKEGGGSAPLQMTLATPAVISHYNAVAVGKEPLYATSNGVFKVTDGKSEKVVAADHSFNRLEANSRTALLLRTEKREVWRWDVQEAKPARKLMEGMEAIAVSAGADYGLALKSDGTVWLWGDNTYGLTGDGQGGTGAAHIGEPRQVAGLTDIVAISAGDYHALALHADGTVWAWGRSDHGQLGDGKEYGPNGKGEEAGKRFSGKPVQVVTAAGEPLRDVVAISAGGKFSMALTKDRKLWAWGSNEYNQWGAPEGSEMLKQTSYNTATELKHAPTNTLNFFAEGDSAYIVERSTRSWVWGAGPPNTEKLPGSLTHMKPNRLHLPGLQPVLQIEADSKPLSNKFVYEPYFDKETGSAMVPLRWFVDELGNEGFYPDFDTKKFVLKVNGVTVTIQEGSSKMTVQKDGDRKEADIHPVPVRIDHGAYYVPVKPLAEALGYDVRWDEEKFAVVLTSKQ